MERKFLWVGIGILAVLAIAIGGAYLARSNSYNGVRYDPPSAAYDFDLLSTGEAAISLHDFRGKLVLLFFGYTSCPDICPATLAELRQLRLDLGALADEVQVVYVTVDPGRDTPERVQAYVSGFDTSFVGLSGDETVLQPVWDAYGVVREIDAETGSAAGYFVTHSARLYLIDPQGRLYLSYPYGALPEDILHDIRLLLR